MREGIHFTLPSKLQSLAQLAVDSYRERGGKGDFAPPELLAQESRALHITTSGVALRRATSLYKQAQAAMHVGAALAAIAAWMWSPWGWLIVAVLLGGSIWCMSRLVEVWKAMATFFVAMDLLTNNVAGWGDAESDLRDLAIFLRGEGGSAVSHRWLDQFEPDFAQLPAEVVALMRP